VPPSLTPFLAYNLLLKSDLLRVADTLGQADIPFLVFKGIPLALTAYGGLGGRQMWDNDILIPRERVVEAHRLLTEQGFRDRAGPIELSLGADFQHVLLYEHANAVPTGLELHWSVCSPTMFRWDNDELFARAQTFDLDGVTCLTLDPEDALLQMATHWAQHGLNKPSILNDLAILWNSIEHTIDEYALRSRAKQIGVWPILCLALHLLSNDRRYNVTVPNKWGSRRAQYFVRAFGKHLQPLVTRAVDIRQERELRVLSWLLLAPERTLASFRRELLPTRARLSFIAGRELSRREALLRLWRRQTGALKEKR